MRQRERFRWNQITIAGSVAHISIVSKKYGTLKTIVDTKNVPLLEEHTWTVTNQRGNFYVSSYTAGSLSRLITKAEKGQVVDHVSRDTLDNRESNLRICTPSQNSMNKGSKKKYKGIWKDRHGRYRATVKALSKKIHTKAFDTEIEAAKAYNDLALKHFGEFALLNVFDQDKTLGQN